MKIVGPIDKPPRTSPRRIRREIEPLESPGRPDFGYTLGSVVAAPKARVASRRAGPAPRPLLEVARP